jgi:hypothetical protein
MRLFKGLLVGLSLALLAAPAFVVAAAPAPTSPQPTANTTSQNDTKPTPKPAATPVRSNTDCCSAGAGYTNNIKQVPQIKGGACPAGSTPYDLDFQGPGTMRCRVNSQ